ncbi:MAG: zinc-binding dehydrogenase [Rhizobiaceae bacterium]
MRVAIFHGPKNITIEDVPDDPVGPLDVLIEVARCGICGSDVVMTSGSHFDYAHGRRLGHESAGTVLEVGREVTRVRPGDRVAVLPNGYCGECEQCHAGRPLFCSNARPLFGGFGERMVITENAAFPYPATVSHAEGALVEPIACGRKALLGAGMEKGATVLVLGAGSVGLASIYWARRLGAGRIVVATRTAARHETAMAIGADEVVLVGGEQGDVLTQLLPHGADIVAECIGKPGMLQQAVERVRLGGSVISMGMCVVNDTLLPAFTAFREATLHFPVGYSPQDFIETIRAFDADRIRPELMVSEVMQLDALPALIEEMRGVHSHQKVQIAPN